MGWHIRFLTMTVLTFGLVTLDYMFNLPVWHLFSFWSAVVWVGTAIRYVYWLCEGRETKLTAAFAQAWAVLQTFTFITFTRLFFRSSSNLDPATANEVAWATAKNMVNQIGGAWNNEIIPEFVYEYRWVVLMFVAGMVLHWLPANWKRRYRLWFSAMPLWLMVFAVALAILVIYQFVTADVQPFIYFQF